MEIRKRKNAVGGGDGAASVNDGDDRDSSTVSSSKPGRVTRSARRIFMFCLAFRVANALLIQTYFNPDEHWQSLEVAHRTVFGYGYLTWEWKRGIRSYLHPMLFAFLYKLLHLTALDTPYVMSKAPRLMQSIFSALGDLYLYKLSDALYGENVASWSLFCQLANWFMFFCMNRTFSNCLETVLTIMGLYYWPCIRKDYSVNRRWGLFIAALACAIRPTSAIIWLYVGMLELFLTPNKVKFIVLEVIPVGSLVLGFTCLLDRLMYGSWVIVPLNFLKFNFLSSGGDYYGTHPWHWYFSQGFLVMLFTFTPLSVAGMIKSKNQKLSALVLWVLTIYSLLGHKEFRFVLPVLPVALIFSGYALAQMDASDSSSLSPSSITKQKQVPRKKHIVKWSPKLTLSVLFLLVTNIPMALYMSLFHQRGTEDATNYLSEEAYKGRVKSILFLMPCHSTPYYSTLHTNIPMQFLDCTPSEEKGQVDESDRFMMDPLGFVTEELAGNWSERPSHIVMFASEERKLRDFIIQHSFREVKRFFHAHFKVDRDLQSSVVVYATNIED
ncbi:hypothetical protein N665_0787s0021 [Sinapis alba]|nr:hypothetical protein N665_0787s0021 [Sinapis alba]